MDAMLTWLEHSALSAAVTHSKYTLGFVSALHVLGFVLIMGSMLTANLRLAGIMFSDRPLREVVAPAARIIAAGVALNIVTGFLMFATRPQTALDNGYFRLKMLLLLGAIVTQFIVRPAVVKNAGSETTTSAGQRLTGVAGIALWSGVMLAAFAFLLLE